MLLTQINFREIDKIVWLAIAGPSMSMIKLHVQKSPLSV